jgi:two-component system chemotaxis sensor kinase CheA
MRPGPAPPEIINDIFRTAHSIKGGGGVFGLPEISNFMHSVETMLDQMRAGKREASAENLALLLEAVDCVRNMFTVAHGGLKIDPDTGDAITRRLSFILGETPARPLQKKHTLWKIRFTPHPNLLLTGNDPLRIFRELAGLGKLIPSVSLDALPEFETIDPKQCHLAWDLILEAETDRDTILETFAWVLDECQLEIQALEKNTPETPADIKSSDILAPINVKQSTSSTRPESTSPAPESIRVSIDKIDQLINLVGELVITQSMLDRLLRNIPGREMEQVHEKLTELDRNTRDLQENVLHIRMLPIRFCFQRFPRLVHDLGLKLGKKVRLRLTGEESELDKTVLEKINDPLTHLIRNALDHGLETPAERLATGKPETGTLELKAFHEGGNIMIQVIDDGRGINKTRLLEKAHKAGLIDENEIPDVDWINRLIFHPGLSTAETISDLSGRGVGMDVVKRNINVLGGDVRVESESGKGTKISIRLPLTLAILEGQLLRATDQIYIIPLLSIVETVRIYPDRIGALPGGLRVYRLRDEHIPIIELSEVLAAGSPATADDTGLLVIVISEARHYAIKVHELLDQQQVVIKSLESNFMPVQGISGATILGDGAVAMILDIGGIIHRFNTNRRAAERRQLATH